MFRRRCGSILVIDAGADPACSLFDLGNAIRKAEIDFGISVAMTEPLHLYARERIETDSDLETTARGFAYGTIDYGGGHTGRLLYIKPSFLSMIPADVRSYGAEHALFPHESTLDQWFSESQFESYRTLGRYQVADLISSIGNGDLPAAFDAAHSAVQQRPFAKTAGVIDIDQARASAGNAAAD